MKRIILVPLILIFFIQWVGAQAPYTEIKVGMMNPKNASSGYLLGLNLGRTIDESLSWGLEINYFFKSYKEDYVVATKEDPLNKTVTIARNQDITTRIIPLIAKLNYERPFGYRSPFYLRGSAGVGWELLWNTENNYLKNKHKTRFFHGFGWQLSAGLGIGISSSGNFFADIFYNNARVKRNQTTTELGLPIWDELDISGFGIKIGVSIVGFGW